MEGKTGESGEKGFWEGQLCEGRLYSFPCCGSLCVSFLLCVIFSVSHLAHFHLTRLFACLVTSVFPISLQAFMDSQV